MVACGRARVCVLCEWEKSYLESRQITIIFDEIYTCTAFLLAILSRVEVVIVRDTHTTNETKIVDNHRNA